ncbi:hypothetical protein EDC65_1037 [Stella humosa]|uniref:Uncharacterized protein n=1 Tax=Stella humosa TaxID=94 RepID=A0A3N1MGU1_9PROT|nr:hypothetical protein [Stella humosa]ROQ01850.1 hypothetical protein EDC65_1037 [Stella humosa]BBK32239.1 hypothetical protein STHU_28730 [Stella humosa]
MPVQAMAGLAAALLVLGGIVIWSERGLAILLDLGAAVAACF